MTFGQRESFNRRTDERRKSLKRADLVFNNRASSVSGLVRNISDNGAKFVIEAPVDIPDRVSLRFSNGEEFQCDVVWKSSGTEFGLKFCDGIEFDLSKTKQGLNAIYQMARNLSPREILKLMETAEYFGDEEIESAVKAYVDAYNDMVGVLHDRILPKQH